MDDELTRRKFAGVLGGALGTTAAPVPRRQFEPCYLRLAASGELARRARALLEIYRACRLCPRRCGVDRVKGNKGVCQSIARAKVYSAHPHFGEERPLVGRRGSGTIFFSNCNLLCVFCQNWEINHRGDGSFISDDRLGQLMVEVQERGCHNINLVTPTHIVPNIVNALQFAVARGLRIPLVYNCGGYEPVEILKLLDGVVDIYLPDFKYMDPAASAKYSSGAADYPEVAAAAIEEMHRQVGDLVTDEDGIALRGLMIRHLVLPENIAGTDKFVEWVARHLGRSVYVNIMGQYRPEHKARQYPELSRRITAGEYRQAMDWARAAGLTRLDPG
jgi:putative pyruvate formate lyase activating enzyme